MNNMRFRDKPEVDDSLDIDQVVSPEAMAQLPQTPFWSTLWKFARPYRRPMLLAALCSVIVGIIVPLQMQFTIKWIIDSALGPVSDSAAVATMDQRLYRVLLLIALFIALSAARILVWIVGYRRMLASIEWILCRLRALFFRHVQRMCFRFHDQVSSGELFNYIMGSPVNSIKQFLQQFCMMVPYQVVGWVLSVGLLASFNWQMTIITVIIVVVIVRLNSRSRLAIREVSANFMRTESEASRYIADVLRGSRAVKIYAMEENVTNLFTHQIMQIRNQGYRLAVRQQIEFIKPEAVQYAGLALIMAAGAYFVVYGEMTAGTFTAFVLSFNMLMQPIISLLQLNLIRANAESGLDRIMRVMQVLESTPNPAPEQHVDAARQAELVKGTPAAGIVFDNVHFAYSEAMPVFQGLSCVIREGESIALVGPSGSGKTTFISLLMRFYDPQQGQILFNGMPLSEYTIRDLRSQFGVVPQDPFIFQASLRDNLRVTNPEASPGDVRRAMDTACMSEFVDELPQGVNTWLGEGGSNLSGGQRQRLAIARAILAKPQCFIFDEATSALDNTSERRIQAAMDNLMRDHTAIVIAHRLSTVRNVDRILVFDHGQIVQSGSFAELSQAPGLFKSLLAAAEEKGHLGE